MNSNNHALSIDEAQIQIEEELIALIKKEVISPNIRFWEKEERRPDEEILKEHSKIYYVKINYEYKKNAKRPHITSAIGVHNDVLAHTELNDVVFTLTPETISELKIFGKKAARVANEFFKQQNHYEYILTGIRFDFVPANKDRTKFIVPYLPLESIRFSKSIIDARNKNNLPLKKYLKSYISDVNALNDFLSAISSNHHD